MRGLVRAFVRQHAHPSGSLGWLAALHMAYENRDANRWTLSLLEIRPRDRVLEVGFGPGLAIQDAAARASRGHVVGVDSSETMLRIARKRNQVLISRGAVTLRRGDVAALPLESDGFDKAFGVNVVYFLRDAVACARELRRVLRPGGTVALYQVAKEVLLRHRSLIEGVYALYSEGELADILREAGFRRVRIEARAFASGRGVCALASR